MSAGSTSTLTRLAEGTREGLALKGGVEDPANPPKFLNGAWDKGFCSLSVQVWLCPITEDKGFIPHLLCVTLCLIIIV